MTILSAFKIIIAKISVIDVVLARAGIADISRLSNKDYLDLFKTFEENNADKAYEIISKCYIDNETDGDKNANRFS